MKTIRIHDLDTNGWLAFDLKDVLDALGPRVGRAFWVVGAVEEELSGIDVTGSTADELERLAQSGERINGRRLAKLANNVRQVIWGEFRGYDKPSSSSPWIVIVAYDSSWFEVRSADDAALARLKVAFKDVRLVP